VAGVHRRHSTISAGPILLCVSIGTLLAQFQPAMDWFTGPWLAIGIGSVLVVGVLIALGVRYLEARSRHDEEATRLQQALVEPLAREPAVAGGSVLPLVSIPLRGPARVELTGWVASRDVRDAAQRAVEREAARLGQRVRIVNRLELMDEAMRRPA
jgi:membrane protein implicated in regulation of membrane protease activity